MDEYDKRIQVDVDAKPRVNKADAQKVLQDINNGGNGYGVDVYVDEKSTKRIVKDIQKIADKYLEARKKAQDVGQEISQMGVGKMSEKDFNASKKQLSNLVKEHQKAALDMVKYNRQLSQSLSTLGVGFDKNGLGKVGISEDDIKYLTTANKDFKNYEKIASIVRESANKFSKRNQTLMGFEYGDFESTKQAVINAEYDYIKKSIDKADTELTVLLSSLKIDDPSKLLQNAKPEELNDFEAYFKRLENLYKRARGSDYRNLFKEDAEDIGELYNTYREYYNILSESERKITDIQNTRNQAKEIMSSDVDAELQQKYQEIEAGQKELDALNKQKQQADKELESAKAKVKKEQDKAKDIEKRNQELAAQSATTTTESDGEDTVKKTKTKRSRKKAKTETVQAETSEQSLEDTSALLTKIEEQFARISGEPTVLKEKFETVETTLKDNVELLKAFHTTLMQLNTGSEKFVDNMIKSTEQLAAGSITGDDLKKQYRSQVVRQQTYKKATSSGGSIPPPASTTSGGSTIPPSGGKISSGGDDGGYTAYITNFVVTEAAKKILADKIKNIKNLTATISNLDVAPEATASLTEKLKSLEGIVAPVADFQVPEDIQEKIATVTSKIKTSTIDVPKVTIKKSVISALKKEISNELANVEIKSLNYAEAVKKFKEAKKNSPIKVSATISTFKIESGALKDLKTRIQEKLKDIKITFKYNLDFIISEESKTTAQRQVDALKQDLKDAKKTAESLENKITSSRNNINSKFATGKKNGYTFSDEDKSLGNQLTDLSNRLNNLAKPAANADTTAIQAYIDEVNDIAKAYKNVQTVATETFTKIDTLVKKNANEKASINLSKQWNDAYASAQKYIEANKRIRESTTLSKMADTILGDFNDLEVTSENLTKLKANVAEFRLNVKQANLEGKTFGQTLKGMFAKFGSWGIVTRIMMLGYSTAKKMFQATKEVDTAMVNLRKVSDETEESYTRFLKEAGKEAKALGTTITELTEATATFSRLGYNLADSTELGKVATMYSKVAENLSAEDASNSIVSTMKAFRMSADEAEKIVDEFNYVGRLLPLYIAICIEQMTISVKIQRWTRPR